MSTTDMSAGCCWAAGGVSVFAAEPPRQQPTEEMVAMPKGEEAAEESTAREDAAAADQKQEEEAPPTDEAMEEAQAAEEAKEDDAAEDTKDEADAGQGEDPAAKKGVKELPAKKARKAPKVNMERQDAVNKILRWCADTEMQYTPEAKRPGTVSYDRYKAYSQGKTLAEALALGSTTEDLVNDFGKGILKVSGPMREKPLALEDLAGENVSSTDRSLSRFLKGHQRLENLAKGGEAKSEKHWCESSAMHVQRVLAENFAQSLLTAADDEGTKVTDEHVLAVLRKWAFRRNSTRKNVAPEDMKEVDSDTFGVIRNQASVWLLTKTTTVYPAVTKLLTRWLKDFLPMQDFACSTIHINHDFAMRRHREKNTLGPIAIRALGDFSSGGQLWYWPDDDGLAAIGQMPTDLRVALDMRSAPAIIDGTRAHEEEPFEGERFSIVFTCLANTQKIPTEIQTQLKDAGFHLPTEEAAEAARFAFPAPKGYGLEPSPVEVCKQPVVRDEAAREKERLKRLRKLANKKRPTDAMARLQEKAKPEDESRKAVIKTNLKQAALKLSQLKRQASETDGNPKFTALKIKGKAGVATSLLARMIEKRNGNRAKEAEDKPTKEAKAAKEPKPAKEPKAAKEAKETKPSKEAPVKKSGSSGSSKGAMVSLFQRLAAGGKKEEEKPKEPKDAEETAKDEKPKEEEKRKEDEKSKEDQKPKEEEKPKEDKPKRDEKAGGEGSSTATPQKRHPGASDLLSSKKQRQQEASVESKAPTPSAAEKESKQATEIKSATTEKKAVSEAVQAAAKALGLSAEGKEPVECQHFHLLAALMKEIEEKPSTAVASLSSYFLVLLRMGETPESLLRTSLGLVLPSNAVSREALEGAISSAFGSAATQLIQEKGLAEAAQEGRRLKRSLRAPPARLTLAEVAEAAMDCRSKDEAQAAAGRASLARALGASRVEGKEAYYMVRLLQGSGPSMGEVHAAVSKAMVSAAQA